MLELPSAAFLNTLWGSWIGNKTVGPVTDALLCDANVVSSCLTCLHWQLGAVSQALVLSCLVEEPALPHPEECEGSGSSGARVPAPKSLPLSLSHAVSQMTA